MKNMARFPQEIYNASLREIHGCAFSAREIEIIAAILLDKPTQQIPDFLPIVDEIDQDSVLFGYKLSERTVASHIDNIYEKLSPLLEEYRNDLRNRITKRDKIKYVIQRSEVRREFEEYCIALQVENAFLNCLKKIFKKQLLSDSRKSTIGNCVVFYPKSKLAANSIIYTNLARHLNDRKNRGETKTITTVLCEENSERGNKTQTDYVLYILSEDFRRYLNANENRTDNTIYNLVEEASEGFYQLLFLLNNWKDQKQIPEVIKRTGYINFRGQTNYYESLFEVLKKLFPDLRFDEEIEAFKEDCILLDPYKPSDFKRKMLIGMSIFSLIIFCIALWLFHKLNSYEEPPIQSELLLPTETSLLQRPQLIEMINDKLKGSNGIQVIALVGIRGAGKTTLARQYAHQQKSKLIWEINAETHESLRSSFIKIARDLLKTEEDIKTLWHIEEIKDSVAREEEIIKFVKRYLKSYSNWFLIYDNVMNFTDIQKYFPIDSNTWGQGKVILITQNGNIQSNEHINHVIKVRTLNEIEKLDLFIRIRNKENSNPFTASQIEKTKRFLKEIPSYPLDIKIAAGYIRATDTSYEKYLEKLSHHDSNFVKMQENILRDLGVYSKSRYGSITMSLQDIIDMHKDFGDLLLFISLLGSQNIPKDLLYKYKEDNIVEQFIYSLNKYSLITEGITSANEQSTVPLSSSIFSIHGSIQKICLAYLVKKLALEKSNKSLKSIIDTIENYIVDAHENIDVVKINLLIGHCETFLTHNNLLPENMKEAISIRLGGIYTVGTSYLKAIPHLEENLKNLKRGDNENHERLLQIQKYLALAYWNIGDYEKVKEIAMESLPIYKKYFPEDYAGIGRALSSLGQAHRELGNYVEAIARLEQSLLIYEKKFPKNHHKIAGALTFLGFAYYDLGNYPKAEMLVEQSYNIYKKYYPDNYYGIGRALAVLGNIHRKLGNLERARDKLEEAITIQKKIFPESYYQVAYSLGILGNIYREQGNYEKAKSLIKKCLTTFEKTFGKDHFEAARILLDLGQVYLLENDVKIAEDHFRKALKIFKKYKHPEEYAALENLAALYLQKFMHFKNQNDKSYARKCLEKALQIAKNHFPKDSSHIARITRTMLKS